MLKSTKNVNTQRGLLFSGGVLCGAAGVVSRTSDRLSIREVFQQAKNMTKGLVKSELHNLQRNKANLTAGEQLFLQFDVTGIRGEVESGFQTIAKFGLPAFVQSLDMDLTLNECLLHTLISIMAKTEDSTIIWRRGIEQLRCTQKAAMQIIKEGSLFTEAGRNSLNQLNKEMISQGISPGGSADLVAITVGAYLLENGQFPGAII